MRTPLECGNLAPLFPGREATIRQRGFTPYNPLP